jgi:hypothetical protein
MALVTLPKADRLYDVIYHSGRGPDAFTQEWKYIARTAATILQDLKIKAGDKDNLSKRLTVIISNLDADHPLKRMSSSDRERFIVHRVATSYLIPILE